MARAPPQRVLGSPRGLCFARLSPRLGGLQHGSCRSRPLWSRRGSPSPESCCGLLAAWAQLPGGRCRAQVPAPPLGQPSGVCVCEGGSGRSPCCRTGPGCAAESGGSDAGGGWKGAAAPGHTPTRGTQRCWACSAQTLPCCCHHCCWGRGGPSMATCWGQAAPPPSLSLPPGASSSFSPRVLLGCPPLPRHPVSTAGRCRCLLPSNARLSLFCPPVVPSPVPVGPRCLHQRKLRWDIAALASAHQGQPLPKSLSVLESTPQVRGMHTIIRNKDTTRDEFIFYSKRLMRLLIEHALSFLPLNPVTVETPQGTVYEGKRFHRQRITGVSILRAGETMEQALTAVCKDIRLGKILIQTNHDTGEPELHYLRLPKEISEDYVILMDSTVSTGAAAMMAVRVLLDHDVHEEKIFLLSLLMAEMGVHSVAYAFPRVRIITTAVDKRVNEEFHIIPGIGNFGDRYFGTDAPSAWCESESTDY
ncbi:uridine-cytidine kinase-like 1 isoform X3 [Malaclemys terrapin pileata]|uniref:uridine-cytidine kinase-like 1 isoform X3 n=1 Tax=Malaclemys terrapin pileata TaxID=2991368 RepID=UPI0023A7EC77|nr:uridine-cytidine kinase-like 1 isoform X3 [Malaclemys terrapin pileata]